MQANQLISFVLISIFCLTSHAQRRALLFGTRTAPVDWRAIVL